jgi:major membrane immunogen (membrane-anchored lipoprotein)
VYRESRGGEVARSFFTQLFEGIGLKGQSELSSHIDGISGATLSVNSMKKMARQALIMAQHLNAT